MKKLFTLSVLLILIAGCNKPATLNGTWKGTDAQLIASDSALIDTAAWAQNVIVHKSTLFTFANDSTFTGTAERNGQKDENKARWRLSPDKKNLILEFSPDFSNTVAIDSLTEKRLVLRHSYPFGTIVMGFEKVGK